MIVQGVTHLHRMEMHKNSDKCFWGKLKQCKFKWAYDYEWGQLHYIEKLGNNLVKYFKK